MAEQSQRHIYRGSTSYLGVYNHEQNSLYLKTAESLFGSYGGPGSLEWFWSFDEDFTEEEREEILAKDPFFQRGIRRESGSELMLFFDDELFIDLTGSSEEWILFVNRLLRALEAVNIELFERRTSLLSMLSTISSTGEL